MKTIKSSGPLLYSANTNQSRPHIPAGKIHVNFVRYETIEYDLDEFNKDVSFKIHDANCEEARDIARLVKL